MELDKRMKRKKKRESARECEAIGLASKLYERERERKTWWAQEE